MVKVLLIISVAAVILVVAIGVVFLFENEVLQVQDGEKLLESNSNLEGINEASDIGEDASEEVLENINGIVEGLNADGDASEEVIDEVNCRIQQIQYSLKNFKNSVECTNTGADGCIRLVANCSIEVYNLNREADGIFGIRYSLVDSNSEELDFELVQKNVRFDVPEVFSVEFIRSNISGVDEDLTCPFTMELIPEKEICN